MKIFPNQQTICWHIRKYVSHIRKKYSHNDSYATLGIIIQHLTIFKKDDNALFVTTNTSDYEFLFQEETVY